MDMSKMNAAERHNYLTKLKRGAGQTVPLDSLVGLPLDLVEDLRDYLWELRGEREWWKDEPRLTYQEDYAKMTADIEKLNAYIEQANSSLHRMAHGQEKESGI